MFGTQGEDYFSQQVEGALARGTGWQSNTVRRALAILELLNAQGRSLTSTEIRLSLSLPKSTASVLLSTLEAAGYLTRDAGRRRYSQSLKASGLGLPRADHLELSRCAMPVLRGIATSFNVTAHLAVLDGDQALFVNKADGQDQPCCDIYPGRRTNLQCTAVGRVLLASMTAENRREFLGRHRLIRHTNKTIANAGEMNALIDRVQAAGYGWDDQEEELFVRCLAVPVFDRLNAPIGALGITGTTNDIRPDNLKFLVEHMKQMSKRILIPDQM